MFNTGPIFSLVLSAIFLKEVATVKDRICIACAFSGVILVSIGSSKNQSTEYPNKMFGVFNAFISGIAIGIIQTAMRKISQNMSFIFVSFYGAVSGLLVMIGGLLFAPS